MLHFDPDRPMTDAQVKTLKNTDLIIVGTELDSETPDWHYATVVSTTRESLRIRKSGVNTPIVSLPMDARGTSWQVHAPTNDTVLTSGRNLVLVGENPDAPGSLRLLVRTPHGDLIAASNPDQTFPEIFLDLVADRDAPSRQVACLQFDPDTNRGFKLLAWGDDDNDDATHVITGTQPSDTTGGET